MIIILKKLKTNYLDSAQSVVWLRKVKSGPVIWVLFTNHFQYQESDVSSGILLLAWKWQIDLPTKKQVDLIL